MKLIAEGLCGRGLVRKENQDHIFVNGKLRGQSSELYCCSDVTKDGIYAVCDGMGGGQWGEEAARIVAAGLKDVKRGEKSVETYLFEANNRICQLIQERDHASIGTTAVILVVSDGIGKIYNIGDSRAYLYHNGVLRQVSYDHNQAQQMVDMGIITKEQARNHPGCHRLTQHLGIPQEEFVISPFTSDDFKICQGEIVLLCSDGLTELLSDWEICSYLKKSDSIKNKADELWKAAMYRGGKDNISLILIECA